MTASARMSLLVVIVIQPPCWNGRTGDSAISSVPSRRRSTSARKTHWRSCSGMMSPPGRITYPILAASHKQAAHDETPRRDFFGALRAIGTRHYTINDPGFVALDLRRREVADGLNPDRFAPLRSAKRPALRQCPPQHRETRRDGFMAFSSPAGAP